MGTHGHVPRVRTPAVAVQRAPDPYLKKISVHLAPKQSAQLEVRIVDPGPYTVYCDLADHADRGMQLTFNVEP